MVLAWWIDLCMLSMNLWKCTLCLMLIVVVDDDDGEFVSDAIIVAWSLSSFCSCCVVVIVDGFGLSGNEL